jgi:hypothetical protein
MTDPQGPCSSARPSIPWGLIGMLVLATAVETFIARDSLGLANHQSFNWRLAGTAARGDEGRSDVLCLGDSMVKLGVLPRVLEERLGGSSYNLALFGGQAPSSFFVLRRALESGAKPRAVVVDFHSNLLAVSPKSTCPYWSDLVDARDALDLAWQTRDLALIAAEVGTWLLPSYKVRDQIRDGFRSALRGQERAAVAERRTILHNWRVQAGAHMIEHPPRAPERIETNPQKRERWGPHPVNVAYLRRFFDLAARHGVPVFWLVPPTHPDWQLRRERLGAEPTFTAFIHRVQDLYPGVVVVDGRHSGYDRSLFLDATHLNARGARKLSHALAGVLKSRLKSPQALPRWVSLPASATPGRDAAAPVKQVAGAEKARPAPTSRR